MSGMKLKNIYRYLAGSLILLGVSSCLENDFPYPVERMYVTGIVLEGQIGNPVISNDEMKVTVELSDTINIRKAHIKEITVTEKGVISIPQDTIVDLSSPLKFNVSLYQDYEWTLTATQHTERNFRVGDQVGEAVFYEETREASVNVPTSRGLFELELTELKLGPEGSTYDGVDGLPKLSWKREKEYAHTTVRVQYKDFIDEVWTLYVNLTDIEVGTNYVSAWTNVAWLNGFGNEGSDMGYEYKEAGSSRWIKVDKDDIVFDKTTFTARLIHLYPNTTYVCRPYSDDKYGDEVEFTTGSETQPENPGFEYTSGTSPLLLYGEGQNMWWDTGNHGSATMNKNVTTVDTKLKHSGNQSLLMSSQFVGLGGFAGKFAAGNLFAGKYLKTDGTDGILGWGRPFTDRPTALKVWVRYTPGIVDYDSPGRISKGDTDKGTIYIAIGDWKGMTEGSETWPFVVKTKNASSLFSKDKGTVSGEGIIAYGEHVFEETYESENGGLKELTIPLNYEDYGGYQRIPSSIIIVASASYYGDFFAGSTESKMWIDDIRLEYDYE